MLALLPAAAPVSVLVLVLVLVLELGKLVDPLLLVLGELVLGELVLGELVLGEVVAPVLEPMLPDAPAEVPPDVLLDCAHDAPATATHAAATAVAIVLTITIESPWSVEQGLQARRCKRSARRATVSLESHHVRKAPHCLHAERSLLLAE